MQNGIRTNQPSPKLRLLSAAQRAYVAANSGQIVNRATLTATTVGHRLDLPVAMVASGQRQPNVAIGLPGRMATVSPSDLATDIVACPSRLRAIMTGPRVEGEAQVAAFLHKGVLAPLAAAGHDVSAIQAAELAEEVLALDPGLRLRGERELPSTLVPALLAVVRSAERVEVERLIEEDRERIVPLLEEAIGPSLPTARELIVHSIVETCWLEARTLVAGSTRHVDRHALEGEKLYGYLRMQGAVSRCLWMTQLVYTGQVMDDVDGIARRAMARHWTRTDR